MLTDRLIRGEKGRFRSLFGDPERLRIAIAPGRVNLIGEHTDYNDGWVLPMAIGLHVRIAFAARSGGTLRAYSSVFDELREVGLESLEEARGQDWFAYVAGVAWAMVEAGLDLTGVDMLIEGDVPLGSGLSSSAALEMATCRVLSEVSEVPWDALPMARLGQRAENEFVGVHCGLMDQIASAAAEPDCALLLDCRNLSLEAVPVPDDVRIVVMDTGSRRSLADSEYNERRASCEEAVTVLQALDPGIEALRDVDLDLLLQARDRMRREVFRRARHVVEENARPAAMALALGSGTFDEVGRLMNESHASLRDLYEVSSPELDRITELARQHPGCYGARLTGAGFGGCAVALVATEQVMDFSMMVHGAYAREFELSSHFHSCRPVAGTRLTPSPLMSSGGTPAGTED